MWLETIRVNALLEIRLNLIELINFGIPMVINNQSFNKNLCKSIHERRLYSIIYVIPFIPLS